jgi:hypothetical protein
MAHGRGWRRDFISATVVDLLPASKIVIAVDRSGS